VGLTVRRALELQAQAVGEAHHEPLGVAAQRAGGGDQVVGGTVPPRADQPQASRLCGRGEARTVQFRALGVVRAEEHEPFEVVVYDDAVLAVHRLAEVSGARLKAGG